jgi:pimeloyl-ACP methyl ester carboxylesterase/membrane protein DedA with SNARE-associated domain
MSRPAGLLRGLSLVWLCALLASWTWQFVGPDPGEPTRSTPGVELLEVDREGHTTGRTVQLAFQEAGDASAPTIVLLHGNPGGSEDFDRLIPLLSKQFHVIAPDLPGFGNSQLEVSDYSLRAFAHYLLQLLDTLDVQRAHLLGFSMGGGVALQAWNIRPERVASVTLLSSIGVQELELLGDHQLNHALHLAQLRLVQGLSLGIPHFGSTDVFDRAVTYARWFSDSDQRPLRSILERIEVPVLVLHGEQDFLVPAAAAVEHARIVPHSELWLSDEGHLMVFRSVPFAPTLVDFVQRVEAGTARSRSDAEPDRLAAAAEPFDPGLVPPATGVFLLVLMLLIAVATLVSEDLACVAAGLMAARGQLSFLAATTGAFVGIFVGDLALFAAGRLLGRAAVRRRPLRWFVTETALSRASRWFERRGMAAIFISRFLPGMRLPTYFAAGVVGTSLAWFALWFALAGVLWTPALVGASMLLGERVLDSVTWLQDHTWTAIAIVTGLMMSVVKLGIPACSHRGRRQLLGTWRRWTRWEFWPPWLFYPPVVLYVGWLALRHGGIRAMTAVNPGIPAGGFVGESKADIHERLGSRARFLPATLLLPANRPVHERVAMVEQFLEQEGCQLPVVLKPDAGQRGEGVVFASSIEAVTDHLSETRSDVLAQQRLVGDEYGVFYYRHPDEESGHVFSITEKRLPEVIGDGLRTVEQLILDDDRACAMSQVYFDNVVERLGEVPGLGETVQIARLGTHCQGAQFLDACSCITPELEATIDHISKGFDGFFFGRYDLTAPSREALMAGRDLRIIELNGLTSEATHIYDPVTPLWKAWSVLFQQWRLAFQIGRRNQQLGAQTTSLLGLARLAWRFYSRRAPT